MFHSHVIPKKMNTYSCFMWKTDTCVHSVTSVDTEMEVFTAVCSEMCSVGGLVQRCRCEPEVVVKWKFAPSSFLSTELDLQAALWPHPVPCCRSLLLCRVSSPGLSPSPTTALTFFCTQMRTLISCCCVVDSHSYIYFPPDSVWTEGITSLF